jgi:acyl-CoA hydrolase
VALFEEIFPGDTNAYGTAFGGKILALIDRAAGLASSRFACANFVTASLDALEFSASVKQGEIAEVEARVVYTSAHTCGVKVSVFAVSKTDWVRRPCCLGTLFMVAIGPDGKPIPVPKLEPAGDDEQKEWNEAAAIHKAMISRRKKKR